MAAPTYNPPASSSAHRPGQLHDPTHLPSPSQLTQGSYGSSPYGPYSPGLNGGEHFGGAGGGYTLAPLSPGYTQAPPPPGSSSSAFGVEKNSNGGVQYPAAAMGGGAGGGGGTGPSPADSTFNQASQPTTKAPKKRRPSASQGGGDGKASTATAEDDEHESKRVKTPRACDRCRGKKTRCDLIPGVEPPICKFCQKNGLDCTFFLPITETRWKKRRTDPSNATADGGESLTTKSAAPAASANTKGNGHPKSTAQPTVSAPKGVADVKGEKQDGSSALGMSPRLQQLTVDGFQQSPSTSHLSPAATRPPPPLPSQLSHAYTPAQAGPSGLGPPHPRFHSQISHPYASKPPPPPPPPRHSAPYSKTSPASGGGSTGSTSVADRTHDRLARIHGPTSIPFLIHSSAAIPPSIWERYDLKHHTTWEISAGGDGVVKVLAPPFSPSETDEEVVGAEMIERLVNLYFEDFAPIFPVVTKNEFLSLENPSPLLLYSICALAATRRSIPRTVFSSLKKTINGIIRSNDILSDTSLVNVQSLLIISNVGDLHGSVGSGGAVGACSVRLGVAIRMAQDLGLHRDEIKATLEMTDHDRMEERAFLELKRRVWAGCVVMDRWYAASIGTPMLIDLLDCDVLLPDPCEVPLPTRIHDPSCQGQPYLFLSEFLKLSILLGRVTKTIYGPTGLLHANDQQLNALVTDLKVWKASLTPALQFVGPTSSMQAGMLHILYTAILFLFWRVFLRISYQCPPHLEFSMDLMDWSEVVTLSHDCVRWLSIGNNDRALDTWFLTSYATTSIALVQYHTWARRKDPTALESLKVLRDLVKRWETAVQWTSSDLQIMAVRRKTLEVMGLLYSAAKHTSPHPSAAPSAAGVGHGGPGSALPIPSQTEERSLNPTTGVNHRGSEWIGQRVSFQRNPSLPGGGLFLAEGEVRKKLQADGRGPNVGPLGAEGMHAQSGSSAAGSGRTPRMGDRPGSGDFEPFNVNPHIHDIGMLNMGAAQVDSSVIDPNFGNLSQDLFSPTTPSNAGHPAMVNHNEVMSMGPVEMLEGLPSSVFDWPSWDNFFGKWNGLDSSPDSSDPAFSQAGGPLPNNGDSMGGSSSANGNGGPIVPPPSFTSAYEG